MDVNVLSRIATWSRTLPGRANAAAETVATRLGSVTAPLQAAAFVRLMNLPERLQRRLVGRPIRLDGQQLATDTQVMLWLTKVARMPDPWSAEVDEARTALLTQCRLAGGSPPVGRVRTVETPVGMGRLYIPTEAPETGPMLVFIHGGGFFLGDLDSHDAPCRMLAEASGVRVLSVEYRLAPEHPFPAAYDDCRTIVEWAVAQADALGADPERIGVGGDSAGGNLAAGVALAAGEACAFQLLLYPVTQVDATTASRELFADGFFLTAAAIESATGHYVPDGTDARDPRLAPAHAEVPAGTAPAYVATAGFDPLRDEGEAYAARLEEAGVPVTLRRFEDQIHGFVNVVAAGRTSRAAVTEIAGALAAGLGAGAGAGRRS